MHADLLVFLAAAWLGRVFTDGWRTLREPQQIVVAVSLAVAVLATSAADTPWPKLASISLAFSAVLAWLGLTLARDGRGAGLRRGALAFLAGTLAVVTRALLQPAPVALALASIALPVALLLLLVPAAAGFELRLREHDVGMRPRLDLLRALCTLILALALVPVLQSMPASAW